MAAGLDDTNQDVIFRKIAPWLLPSKKRAALKKVSDAELHELWMLAASLEQLSPDTKIELGNELMRTKKKWKGKSTAHYYWALSRLGARVPFHGPVERTVPREVVEQWIRELLDMQWEHPKDTVYALTQLARKTGDRVRDIDEDLGNRIVEKLSAMIGQNGRAARLRTSSLWNGRMKRRYSVNRCLPGCLLRRRNQNGLGNAQTSILRRTMSRTIRIGVPAARGERDKNGRGYG